MVKIETQYLTEKKCKRGGKLTQNSVSWSWVKPPLVALHVPFSSNLLKAIEATIFSMGILID